MITLHQVTKHYGSVMSLDDVSLEISAGEIVVIQGPSGSGKTTLLRLIAGLETPTRGQISIAGEQVSTPSGVTPAHTRGIGLVFQRSALWPHMTVVQNIRFAMHELSIPHTADRLEQLLEDMMLKKLANRYPNQLSGGEARRVALARALSNNPHRLLLDEPLTSLDPEQAARMLDLILNYADIQQATLLYVTHISDEANQVGGRLIRLQTGRVVEA